jgi:protein-S-isoprenylcysteine O-methyltransferase Ste14
VLGFGLVINAFFVIVSAFISFVIAKFLFIEKQEKVLAEKYGAPYLEYKKSVKF